MVATNPRKYFHKESVYYVSVPLRKVYLSNSYFWMPPPFDLPLREGDQVPMKEWWPMASAGSWRLGLKETPSLEMHFEDYTKCITICQRQQIGVGETDFNVNKIRGDS